MMLPPPVGTDGEGELEGYFVPEEPLLPAPVPVETEDGDVIMGYEALADWDIAVQDVDPEDKVCCPLLQALQPPPLPSVSRPLALYVFRGHFARHTLAPENEIWSSGQRVQPEPTPAPSLSSPAVEL
jgi:hypothetical protein